MSCRPVSGFVALVLAAAVSGCGSIMARGYMEPDFPERQPPPYFYRGVVAHVQVWSESAGEEPAVMLVLAVPSTALDFVLCLVADTLLLPVDLAVWLGASDEPDDAEILPRDAP